MKTRQARYAEKQYQKQLDTEFAGLNPLLQSLSTKVKRVIIKEVGKDVTIGTVVAMYQTYQFHHMPGIGKQSLAELKAFIEKFYS